MKRISKKTYIIFILLCVILFAGLVPSAKQVVFADDNPQEFEFTESEEQLYEYLKYDDVTLIRFYENGYGRESNYSLSFYIYNPNRVKFAQDTRNRVQIGYANNSTDVFRAKYNKYTITKDGQSETGLFVRFKILGFNMPVDVDRFYCFSGLELVTAGAQTAKEYPVSTVYQCTTADGMTTISTSTLPTCEVDVNHTYYRTNVSEKGDYWRNQLSMCYFSLPKNLSAKSNRGELEALTAEFYNYYTKHILILESQEFFTEFQKYIGVNRENESGYNSAHFYAGHMGTSGGILPKTRYKLYYGNVDTYQAGFDYSDEYINTLYWAFYDKIDKDEPDFRSEDYRFSGEYLRTYFYNYAEQHGRGNAIVDLFLSESEYKAQKLSLGGFDYGYNKHTYSIAEKPENEDDVFGFKFNDNGFRNFFGVTISQSKEIVPLIKIDPVDIFLSDDKFSEKYYIEKNEVSEIKAYVVEQAAMNKETWILRYDVCEYFAAPTDGSGLVAQESIYLDFDILSFRFSQGNSKYTVANIDSPEDVFNDITGNKQPLSWWEKLLELLGRIGAWVSLAVFIAVGLLGLWFFSKIIRFISDVAKNTAVRVILIILVSAVMATLLFFYVMGNIDIITMLGGLW